MNFTYTIASLPALERIWQKNIDNNPDEPNWLRWREEYIHYNTTGMATTFLVLADGDPVGEGTLILSPDCKAVADRPVALADGKRIANVNALRIEKTYEGQGHISRMMRELENHARSLGYTHLSIGVEAREARNLAIYLHWGYRTFLMSEVEDGELILYYAKEL